MKPNTYRVCRQCGERKPIERFRRYYGNRKGYYTICLDCERINSRYKYLCRKGSLSGEELNEQVSICKLYDTLRAAGLRPPQVQGKKINEVSKSISNLMKKYSEAAKTQMPLELTQWLTQELTEAPEYYLDQVYELLLEKYRPILRIDPSTLLPVYDNTYKEALNKILGRFYDYEDTYYK